MEIFNDMMIYFAVISGGCCTTRLMLTLLSATRQLYSPLSPRSSLTSVTRDPRDQAPSRDA